MMDRCLGAPESSIQAEDDFLSAWSLALACLSTSRDAERGSVQTAGKLTAPAKRYTYLRTSQRGGGWAETLVLREL